MGFVTSSRDYLLFIEGLPSAKIDDLIETSDGNRALVTGLEREKVEALMLDPDRPIPGDSFTIKYAGLQLPKASKLLGRVINPLGEPLDGFISSGERRLLVVYPFLVRRKRELTNGIEEIAKVLITVFV